MILSTRTSTLAQTTAIQKEDPEIEEQSAAVMVALGPRHLTPAWHAPPELRRSRLHGTRMRCGTLNCSRAETKREAGQRMDETSSPPGTEPR